MSNRASKLAQERAAAKVEPVEPKAVLPDAAAALRVVPLKLGPLLAPYRKHGRLSLRIERMPQLARLSAGRNNGNGSWSLGGDELDELSYMVPESAGAHSLAIRVISVDRAAGNTLAVLDYRVSLDGMARAPDGEAPAPSAAPALDGAALRPLRDELAAARATLSARENELAEMRRCAELAEAELTKHRANAERAAAHADWKAELDERLTAAVAQGALDLQEHRKDWEAEQAERASKLEARALERLLEARERWQKEQEDRLAAVDAAWEQKLAKALGEARAKAGQGKVDETELRALHEKLATLKAKLAERDAALETAEVKREEERARWRREAEAALRKAEQAWTAKEAERLAASESHWQKKLVAAQDEIKGEERSDAALRGLREELGTLKDALDAARESAKHQVQAALRNAETAWTAKEAQWREELAAARSDVKGGHANEAEPQRLREELGALKRALGERDTDLAQLRAEAALAERSAALAQAQAEQRWQAEEAARIAAVETEWRQYSETALAEAAQRCEGAEEALAQLRREMEAAQYNAAIRAGPAEARAAAVGKIVLRTDLAWRKEEEEQAARQRPAPVGHLVRDALLAAGFAASVIFMYPSVRPYLPAALQLGAPPIAPAVPAPAPAAEPSPAPEEAAAPAASPPRMATALKEANVRTAPSLSAAIVSRLPRGTAVPLGEQRGDWILVRVEDKAGKAAALEGWVHSSMLREDGAAKAE
jgi:hypothetical protein